MNEQKANIRQALILNANSPYLADWLVHGKCADDAKAFLMRVDSLTDWVLEGGNVELPLGTLNTAKRSNDGL